MVRPVKRHVSHSSEAERSRNRYIPSDVLGSYTGVPLDGDRPVQDADDL